MDGPVHPPNTLFGPLFLFDRNKPSRWQATGPTEVTLKLAQEDPVKPSIISIGPKKGINKEIIVPALN